MVNGLDRMLVQLEQVGHVLNRHQAHKRLNPLDHACSQMLTSG